MAHVTGERLPAPKASLLICQHSSSEKKVNFDTDPTDCGVGRGLVRSAV